MDHNYSVLERRKENGLLDDYQMDKLSFALHLLALQSLSIPSSMPRGPLGICLMHLTIVEDGKQN